MSGPVDEELEGGTAAAPAVVELSPSRDTRVGGHRVRRALPQRRRRTVGAWCFADHLGPLNVPADGDLRVGPHPHIGLQTATWLVAGEILHRDSLGTEQPIRPGQLNLMTAGHGVSHSEEGTARFPETHGIQLWIAQPEASRHGPPEFEHLAEPPQLDLESGSVATVLIGSVGPTTSTVRRDTDHFGAEIVVRGRCEVPLQASHEHAVVVLEGTVAVDDAVVVPGSLGYLGAGREAVELRGDTRLLLLGGEPFDGALLMWWNFVGRTREEIDAAARDWESGSERFGDAGSPLDRIPVPRRPWSNA